MSGRKIRIKFLSLNDAAGEPFSNVLLYMKKLIQLPSSDGSSIQLEERDARLSFVFTFNESHDLSMDDKFFQILFLQSENDCEIIADIIFYLDYLCNVLERSTSDNNNGRELLFCAPLDQKYTLRYTLKFVERFVKIKEIRPKTPEGHLVQDHLMVPTQFNEPVYCAICKEFIWGMANQGYQCQRCSLVTDKKCREYIPFWCGKSPNPEPCYYTGNRRLENCSPHVYKPYKPSFSPFTKRPCCNCGKYVSKNALKCSMCGFIIHEQCQMSVPAMCGVVYKVRAKAFEKNMIQTKDTSSLSTTTDEEVDACSDSSSLASSQLDPIPKFSDFEFIGLFGKGGFSAVFCARHGPSQKCVAIKVVDGTNESAREQVENEREILFRYSHENPHMIKGYCSFHQGSNLFLVMECVGDDTLKHRMSKAPMNENQIRYYLAEIISAVQFLHSKKIVHRDLKLEHILVCSDGHIRLIDYGLARTLNTKNDVCCTICGSRAYMAPEVRRSLDKDSAEGYSYPVDYWAIGKMFLEMLCNDVDIYDGTNDSFNFVEEFSFPRHVSLEARSLALGLLEDDPEKRLGASIRQHSFFKMGKEIDWADVDDGIVKSVNGKPCLVRYDSDPTIDLSFSPSSLDRGPFPRREWANIGKSCCSTLEEELQFKSFDYINQSTWNRFLDRK